MKRRNWALIVIGAIGLTGFILSRTVWGPPAKAIAAESHLQGVADESHDAEEMSDAKRRYLTNQPRHWRYIMLRTR